MSRAGTRALACAFASALLAACGSPDATKPGGGTSTGDNPRAASTVPQMEVSPGPEAVLLRREQDRLLDAYAPVSEYASFLVAADRMHASHLDQPGSLAAAARAYLARLRTARTQVGALANISQAAQARTLMLAGLDARVDAMKLLVAWAAVEKSDPIAADRLRDRYLEAWNSSVASARGVTNLFQDDRHRVGLPPAQEDGIR